MLGLFGSLNLGARSLQTQQMGIEVAGHNLANVNNPAYSRQRLDIDTSLTVPTAVGPEGTGARVVAIQQARSVLLDGQLQSEISVSGYFEAQQQALENAQANLAQQIGTGATGTSGAASTNGGPSGLAAGLTDLFSGFQNLSTDPSSMANRQVLLLKAQTLASQFNQTDQRLSDLHDSLNDSLQSDIGDANQLLSAIAKLNDQIVNAENATGTIANDLRDQRQAKVEDLAKLVKFDATRDPSGAVNISIGGASIVSGSQVLDTLQTYDAGGGQLLVRTQGGGAPLTLTGGRIAGTIEGRDDGVDGLRAQLNALASELISRVNTVHTAGFSLSGATGEPFFTGADASTMQVNANLLNNPSLIQASGTAGAAGDNQTVLALAQLGTQKLASLNNQIFSESFGQTVAQLGQELASSNSQSDTQAVVEKMLRQQRDSISGVSLDEEMTNLVTFQRAYQASARLITTVDQMLQTLIDMKR